jgi:hypothetical protein
MLAGEYVSFATSRIECISTVADVSGCRSVFDICTYRDPAAWQNVALVGSWQRRLCCRQAASRSSGPVGERARARWQAVA